MHRKMSDLKSYYLTVAKLLQNEGHEELSHFCNERYMSDQIVDHDNWDGGIDTYSIDVEVPVDVFGKWQSVIEGGVETLEKLIAEAFDIAVRGINSIRIGNVTIRPIARVDEKRQKRGYLSMPLHFEVQIKQGQRADYLASVQPPKRYPCFILVFNWDWTDYEYHTWFCLFYFASEADRRMIGELKLMNSEQDNTMDALPEEFDEPLDDSFCSLGIKTDYYIGLRQELKNEQLIKEVQHYLCDCTFEPAIYDQHRDERIFNVSLMRDLSAMDALQEGQSLAMGIEPDEMYSFSYTYHPKYDNSLYADWKVHIPYKPLKFMRTFGIIGINGVGKTQILSSFITDLLAQKVDNFKSLPHFKNIIVICSTPFDSYPVEKQDTREIVYRLCCLEQDKTLTLDGIKQNLNRIMKQPTVEHVSMLTVWVDLIREYVDSAFVDHVVILKRDADGSEYYDINGDDLGSNVNILSSGQLHILSLVTYICANIHYRSLLFIDEPEVHLHPHITMEFMAMLSGLLSVFKSYAIIATHTPLVVREMAGKNVFLMQKMQDGIPQIAPVGFETLGEDVGTLYRNLFGYDEQSSYFKKMVDKLCDRGKSYEEIVRYFQQGMNLNINARLIIRDTIEARSNA
mgnify:CR=1 FL=1